MFKLVTSLIRKSLGTDDSAAQEPHHEEQLQDASSQVSREEQTTTNSGAEVQSATFCLRSGPLDEEIIL